MSLRGKNDNFILTIFRSNFRDRKYIECVECTYFRYIEIKWIKIAKRIYFSLRIKFYSHLDMGCRNFKTKKDG